MIKFREEFIDEVSATEIDLDWPFYDGDDKNEVEEVDPRKIPFSEAPSIDIDMAIKILNNLKESGSNRVYIAGHCDHHGYYFYGVKLEEISN